MTNCTAARRPAVLEQQPEWGENRDSLIRGTFRNMEDVLSLGLDLMEASSAGENRQSQEWFLATLIMEISVQGDTRNVVHRNLFLVSACSPEEAYDKAMRLGREGETTYGNPAGRAVRHSFRGVAQLDTLVDGELVKNGDRKL